MTNSRTLRPPLTVTIAVWKALFLREAVSRLAQDRIAWALLIVEPLFHVVMLMWVYSVGFRQRVIAGADVGVFIMVGILGGLFVAVFTLDLPAVVYFRQMRAYMTMWDVGQGLLKALVFAVLIAGIGCWRGFDARAGAESVGRVTTAAIVSGIFAIICADAVFTVLFNVW